MTIPLQIARPIGTMIVYGFTSGDLARDLDLALKLGARCVEVLPQWRSEPDAATLKRQVADTGLFLHSAHGCWGTHTILARRVDLASTDPATRSESLDDIRRCVDWLALAGGRCLVVHPGGLSEPNEARLRRDALLLSLSSLANHAEGTGVVLCVENMPPGVHPGSRMAELAAVVDQVDRREVGLALDTGHANLVSSAGEETRKATRGLMTTHVHDNDGRRDVHLPPGGGTVDWSDWVAALDEVRYDGPVMLECIREIRENPTLITRDFLKLLDSLSGIA